MKNKQIVYVSADLLSDICRCHATRPLLPRPHHVVEKTICRKLKDFNYLLHIR